jgi:hypothetical protein
MAAITLPDYLWTAQAAGTRVGAAVLALVPLLPAMLLFHRYSPDRVKARAGRRDWSPLALLNGWLRPCARLARPLFALAARLPASAGHALALLALVLATNPAALAAMLVLLVAGCVAGSAQLGAVLIAAIIIWGILVSEISVRDMQHDVDALNAAAPGGRARAYAAQWLASVLLALLFTAPVLLRWLATTPLRAAALLSGVLALSAAAIVLGGLSRTARLFLSLFLFGMYVATQARSVPALDVAGFNGAATVWSVLAYLLAAVVLLSAGWLAQSRRN